MLIVEPGGMHVADVVDAVSAPARTSGPYHLRVRRVVIVVVTVSVVVDGLVIVCVSVDVVVTGIVTVDVMVDVFVDVVVTGIVVVVVVVVGTVVVAVVVVVVGTVTVTGTVVVNGIDVVVVTVVGTVVVSVVVTVPAVEVRHTPPGRHDDCGCACALASTSIGPAITADSAAQPPKIARSCLFRGIIVIPARPSSNSVCRIFLLCRADWSGHEALTSLQVKGRLTESILPSAKVDTLAVRVEKGFPRSPDTTNTQYGLKPIVARNTEARRIRLSGYAP
jgi:hypothetical protein